MERRKGQRLLVLGSGLKKKQPESRALLIFLYSTHNVVLRECVWLLVGLLIPSV